MITLTTLQRADLIAKMIRRRKRGKIIPPVLLAGSLRSVPISTPYREHGSEWSLGYHTGEDHACPPGSYALAVSWGTVLYVTGQPGNTVASWGADYGTHVIIRTGSGRYDYMHAHLSVTLVRPGDKVRPGEIIGLTGATGHVTGPHDHFEARPAGGRFGSDVDPRRVKQLAKVAPVR